MLAHNGSRRVGEGCDTAWGVGRHQYPSGSVWGPYARWGSPLELKALGPVVNLGAAGQGWPYAGLCKQEMLKAVNRSRQGSTRAAGAGARLARALSMRVSSTLGCACHAGDRQWLPVTRTCHGAACTTKPTLNPKKMPTLYASGHRERVAGPTVQLLACWGRSTLGL